MQCGLEEKYKAKRLCDLNFMETKLSGKNERRTHKTPKMIVLFLIKKKKIVSPGIICIIDIHAILNGG